MSYIDNYKFREILKAGKDGNEDANDILRAIRNNAKQERINILVDKYYKSLSKPAVEEPKETPAPVLEQPKEIHETEDVVDLTSVLDVDLDGVISDDELTDDGFAKYLRGKVRAKDIGAHNSDYFKQYDEGGRKEYKARRIAAYKAKLDAFMRKIEREYNDVDYSIGEYKSALEQVDDDGREDNGDDVLAAYKKLIDDDAAMDSLPRYHDDSDRDYLVGVLEDLVKTYGKRNVLAAINGIAYGNKKRLEELRGNYDEHINKYTLKLSELLD